MGGSALCGLLSFSTAALASLAGASVIGFYVSYIVPVFLRITCGRDKLLPGAFSLGEWYLPIGIVAVAWVVFVVVLLCFPTAQATTAREMNYAAVIIMGVFSFASLMWVLLAHK